VLVVVPCNFEDEDDEDEDEDEDEMLSSSHRC
jgi:hypothetical protein